MSDPGIEPANSRTQAETPVRNISPVIQAEFILYFARNFASFYTPGDLKNILDSGWNPGVKQGRNM